MEKLYFLFTAIVSVSLVIAFGLSFYKSGKKLNVWNILLLVSFILNTSSSLINVKLFNQAEKKQETVSTMPYDDNLKVVTVVSWDSGVVEVIK